MGLDTDKLGAEMIAAAAAVFKGKWPEIEDYAETEFQGFAQALARISARYATGKLNQQNAQAMVRAQVKSMEIVFLAVEGLGILMVESAINAAIAVVRQSVNDVVGFALL